MTARAGGRRRAARVLGCVLACCVAVAGGQSAARAVDEPAVAAEKAKVEEALERLETAFAKLRTVDTAFEQEKRLAMLRKPVVLKGRIVLEFPDRLAWHVTEPLVYSLVLEGDVLRQWDEDTDKEQEISLASNPAFKTVAGQLKLWFSGRYTSLLGEYDAKIGAEDPQLRLDFVPLERTPAAKAVKSVSVTFAKDERYVTSIQFKDTTGDVTTLSFSDTKLNEPVAKDAWNARRNAKAK